MTNTAGAQVSLAIPVFNGERFLKEALISALTQTRPLAEIKVYDNASEDSSASIARSLLAQSDVIVRERNLGAAENFTNAAVRSSDQAEYFVWLAADDRLDPEFVSRTVEILDNLPDAPACLTGVRFIDETGVEVGRQTDLPLASQDPSTRLRAFLRRPRWTEFYCLYRRSALLKSPMLQREYGGDVLLTWWLLLRSPLAVTDEPLLEYRIGAAKSVHEVQNDLTPASERAYWHYVRLWKSLRVMTYDPDVERDVGRIARRELRSACIRPDWLVHFASDLTGRWPLLRRPALLVRDRLMRRRTTSLRGVHHERPRL